jgi:hypothetical protein
VLLLVAAIIVIIGQIAAKAKEDQAAAKEREAGQKSEQKRIRAKDTVTAIPCGTPANPCSPGVSKASKSMLRGGLLNTDSGFSASGPSATGSPAMAPATGRGPR